MRWALPWAILVAGIVLRDCVVSRVGGYQQHWLPVVATRPGTTALIERCTFDSNAGRFALDGRTTLRDVVVAGTLSAGLVSSGRTDLERVTVRGCLGFPSRAAVEVPVLVMTTAAPEMMAP